MNNVCDPGDLHAYLTHKRQRVNQALDRIWERYEARPTPLLEAMRYSLEAGGKRLRPILCICAAETVGGSENTVIEAACALELIHTYSLIHDDLPGMDNDDFRRGKPTCHKMYGEATAILAGDALLTAAFEVLAEAVQQGDARVPDFKWIEAIRVIARASGVSGMVQGQMLDLASEKKAVSWEELKILQQLKTGALIQASLHVGALLGGGDSRQIQAMCAFGGYIGLAFQMADDILNVEGDARITGKPVGSDAALQKATGPSVLGLDAARAYAKDLVDRAREELAVFEENAAVLAALARYVVERDR
ncbi:MAG: polyprenyl synthetase family protein [Deltaproteobacteria bacterium]|nr:polyprenyl synthetase family protein [Deltaproteobacteria bacterium]